jgi:hypothetical protein
MRKLSSTFIECTELIEGNEKDKIADSFREVELLWENYAIECSSRQKLLEDINKKWKTFESLANSIDTWMHEAERLIEKSKLSVCKVCTRRLLYILDFL